MTKKSLTQPDPNNRRRVISLLVDNQSGVLARVSSLFNRRGFNIDSLTVSTTNDPGVSRITLTTHGSDREIEQLILESCPTIVFVEHDRAFHPPIYQSSLPATRTVGT